MQTHLRQLRYFVEIARSRSFSRAAAHLAVAQPALSQNIAALEESLGCVLFERHARGVTLSPAGERLYERAMGILAQVDGLRNYLTGECAQPSGQVRLSLAGSVSAVVAAPLFLAVAERFPQIELILSDGLSSDTRRQMASGQAHLALMPSPAELLGMEAQPVFEEQFMVFGAAERMRRAPRQIRWADVLKQPLAAPDRAHDLRKVIERAAVDAGLQADVRYELNSPQMLLSVVRAGLARAVLPLGACHDAVATGALVGRPITAPVLSRVQAIVWPLDRGLSPACAAVRDVLTSVVQEAVRQGHLYGRLV